MTQLVDINYIRNALGITGTAETCKGCRYANGYELCATHLAPSFAYVCEVLDDAPTVDAIPIAFIRSEIKNSQGVYSNSMRILLDTWEREKE